MIIKISQVFHQVEIEREIHIQYSLLEEQVGGPIQHKEKHFSDENNNLNLMMNINILYCSAVQQYFC